MIANEEKMKFKKFRKNTCIGYRFMLLWLSTKGYRSERKNFKKFLKSSWHLVRRMIKYILS